MVHLDIIEAIKPMLFITMTYIYNSTACAWFECLTFPVGTLFLVPTQIIYSHSAKYVTQITESHAMKTYQWVKPHPRWRSSYFLLFSKINISLLPTYLVYQNLFCGTLICPQLIWQLGLKLESIC